MEYSKMNLTEEEQFQLRDNLISLLIKLSEIGVQVANTEESYKDSYICYKILVPEKSYLFNSPEENAKAAKQILIDNAKEFGIDSDSIKVMYNIKDTEFTKEDSEKLKKITDEYINENILTGN